jgi:hypothetical protein
MIFQMEEAKVLMTYWYGKQENAAKMDQKLLAPVRENCPSDSTPTHWIRRLKRREDIYQHASGSGRLPEDRPPVLIVAALEESPVHSVHSLASAVRYPLTTVWQHLYSSGDVLRHSYLIPHTFSPDQKATRIAFAIELKKF